MSVIINHDKCVKCGICVEICPEDILTLGANGVVVAYPDECCWCDSCEMDCPAGAIKVRFTKKVGPIFMERRR